MEHVFCSIMHTKTCDIILKSKLLAMTSPVAASLAGGSNGEGIAKIALQSKIKNKKKENENMKEKMKKLVALLMVMSLAIGVAQLTQGTTAEAAGKYKLKLKNQTVEVGEEKEYIPTTSSKVKSSQQSAGKSLGYGLGISHKSLKCKVVSGKDKISVKAYNGSTSGSIIIKGKKKGTAKIKVTVSYYDWLSEEEGWVDGKKLATVTKTMKVTVKKMGEVPKSKCKVSDENIKLTTDDDDYEVWMTGVYNKKKTACAIPVVTYKVISGGECVKVTSQKAKVGEDASALLGIKAVAAGTAEIQMNVTWKKYQISGKKLLDKSFATSTSKITVTVTNDDEDKSSDEDE